jgi:hypothetical protein
MEATMPVVSFPCTITTLDGALTSSRRRTWIKGHDFRALLIAATKEVGAEPEVCTYTLFKPVVPNAGVFFEVLRDDADVSAHVGPMNGPAMPETFVSGRYYRLDAFLSVLGFNRDGGPLAADAFIVIVKDSGLWDGAARPPQRGPRDTPDQHKKRCEAAERAHVDRARHEGVHVVHYEVPPVFWRAEDLEQLMALAYRLLPPNEPRWPPSSDHRARDVDPDPAGGGADACGRGRDVCGCRDSRRRVARTMYVRDASMLCPAAGMALRGGFSYIDPVEFRVVRGQDSWQM